MMPRLAPLTVVLLVGAAPITAQVRFDARLGVMASSNLVVDSIGTEPLTLRQTYRYERDETTGPDANRTIARRYAIMESGADGVLTTFWADEHGIALRQEFTMNGALHTCEMTNYRWLG